MGTQNLNNYYFNKLDTKLDYSSYYDLYLASDEKDYKTEVIWSTSIIGSGDTSVLPVIIDLSDTNCGTQPVTTCAAQYPIFTAFTQNSQPFTILSSVSWLSAQTICDCPSTTTVIKICDVSVADLALSNGLYDVVNWDNVQLLPPSDCVEIYKTLPTGSVFNKLHFDKRFKMSQVKGYGLLNTTPINTYYTDTTILNASDNSGYYQELRGGFYQGFYKLQNYDSQVLPTRPNKGWTFSSYLKLNTIGSSTQVVPQQTTASGNCYNSSGYNGLSATTLCSNPIPGTVSSVMPTHLLNYSWKNATTVVNGNTNNGGFFFFKGVRLGKSSDLYSNALGFRITDDMRIGYRAIRWSADCMSGGTECEPNNNWHCYTDIEESYSDPICPYITLSGNCENTWIQVDVVFERNLYLEGCELYNLGGINDLIMTPTTYWNNLNYSYSANNPCDTFHPGPYNFDCTGVTTDNWFKDRQFRLGTLTFYVNGRRVHKVENYEEIIPRNNNTNPQFGVPYTMSWGGGAMGYREDVNSSRPIGADPIQKYFSGSFIGGISQMLYYIKPLSPDEVYHNFKINKERYTLIDCEESKNCLLCPRSGETRNPIVTASTSTSPYTNCPGENEYLFTTCNPTITTGGFSGASQYLGNLSTGDTTTNPQYGSFYFDHLPGTIPGCYAYNTQILWEFLGSPVEGDVVSVEWTGSQTGYPNFCWRYDGNFTPGTGLITNIPYDASNGYDGWNLSNMTIFPASQGNTSCINCILNSPN